MKEMFFSIVKIVIGLAIMTLIMIGVCYLVREYDKKIYNNGVCTECGGHYEYEQTICDGHKYVYRCDECHKMIKLENYFK